MGSSFGGLNIVVKGLFAQQAAMNVTGHNISNVNTDGYSRQRAVLETTTPEAVGSWGMLGTGATVQQIERLRNSFLDVKFWGENMVLGEWEARSDILSQIEAVFNEPSDAGINTVLANFFDSLQDLTEDPGSLTVRELVRENAVSFTNTLNYMANQFQKIQNDINFSIETKVKELNSYAKQISDLNQQIMRYEIDGSNANDLRDRRDLLVDKMSKIADVKVFEDADGRFRLNVGGRLMVNHNTYNELMLVERTTAKNPDVDVNGLYDIEWDDGMSFNPKSGELKGLLDMRDGDGSAGTYKGVPYYMRQLNTFAREFAAAFNAIHTEAYGLVDDGYEEAGGDMIYFFTSDSSMDSYYLSGTQRELNTMADITAANITISKEILNDLNCICFAESFDTIPEDAAKGLELANLRYDKIFPTFGTPEDFVKSLVSALGVNGQEAIRMRDNQEILVTQTDTIRMSTSSVSIDEEMANMIKYQHSYNAAARMITTMDEMLEMIVSRMGVVGR